MPRLVARRDELMCEALWRLAHGRLTEECEIVHGGGRVEQAPSDIERAEMAEMFVGLVTGDHECFAFSVVPLSDRQKDVVFDAYEALKRDVHDHAELAAPIAWEPGDPHSPVAADVEAALSVVESWEGDDAQ